MSKRPFQILIAILILLSSGAIGFYIIHTRPKIRPQKPPKLIPLVKIKKVHYAPYKVILELDGRVRASKKISLVPQVAGKIVYVSPHLKEGGNFKKGELLFKIEDKDYVLAIYAAEAQVKKVESDLETLQARAQQAIKEWYLTKKTPPPPLVSKEPEIRALKAQLEAAKAQLEKARLNLARTKIYAPFEGRTLKKLVDIGQYVAPPQVLAQVYSTQEMEVVSYASPEDLKWIKPGAKVEIISDINQKKARGTVKGLGGEVDEKTGLVPIIIEVNPKDGKKLLPEDYVKVLIHGPTLKKATVVPLNAIHQERGDQVVWIVDQNNRLRFKKIQIAFIKKDEVVITKGLKEGEKVIVSPLSIVSEGMKVRVEK